MKNAHPASDSIFSTGVLKWLEKNQGAHHSQIIGNSYAHKISKGGDTEAMEFMA